MGKNATSIEHCAPVYEGYKPIRAELEHTPTTCTVCAIL